MRRKTLLNRNVIIVLMLFIFLMTAFISTAYSFWYFPDESLKTVNTDMKVDDIEENFKDTGSYLKIIDCRDGVIPQDADFAKSESGFLDNSKNFSEDGNIFIGKDGNYSKKVFGVSSSKVNALYKYPLNPTLLNPNPEGEYVLKSFVSSVFYRSGTSITSSGTSATGSDTSVTGSGTSMTDMTEIYLYDLLNSQYKLVDHLTNESIELKIKNGTSSDGGNMDKPLDAKLYSSTKFEDYREKIGNSFSKSKILFLVPRDTKLIKKETPKVVSNYNIYFHNEATSGEYDPSNGKYNYSDLDHVWLWNDRTDFGVSLPLNTDSTNTDGKSYKSLHINYRTLYNAWNCDNSFKNTNETGFIMTPQTAPTGIIFKTKDGTKLAPKDTHRKTEFLALPLPPINSTSNSAPLHFNIHIDAARNGKFTISTDQDVDLNQDVDLDKEVDLTQNKNAKNKNIVYYSTSSTSPTHVLDHLWMWSKSEADVGRWISSNYVYQFNMAGFDKPVSCFSYNYGEKFNFYNEWKGPVAGLEHFTPGFTFDKKKTGEKKDYNYDSLVLVDYNNPDNGKTENIDISGLFNGTSECTSIYLLENNKKVQIFSSKAKFINALKNLK